MNPIEREFKYEDQNGTPRLTPAQGRRARHKQNSRKTHDHSELVVVDEATGRVRRQRCSRCSPAAQVRAVGGVRA